MCNCGQSVKKTTSVKQVTKRVPTTRKTTTRRIVVKRPLN